MTRNPALLVLPGVNILVKDDTIFGKKLARASSSAIAVFKAFTTVAAASLTLFELLSARLSNVTRTASPNAGMLLVAVRASLPDLVRKTPVRSSPMHLKASACSSSDVAAMPLSADEGLARKVNKIRSCPDRAGSRPPPQPERKSVDIHSRLTSSARTGTCRDSLRT